MISGIMTLNAPDTWQLYRLGQIFSERKESGSDTEYPPISVTKAGIVPQLEKVAKTDDGNNRKIVRVGDYAINSRSDRKGSGGISNYEGSTSQITIVLKPQNILPQFAHHLLRSSAFQEEFYRWGHGIVADLWTTRYSDMKNIRIAIPDSDNQRKIAHFLNIETARIDALIEKKEQTIELLRQRYHSKIVFLSSGYPSEQLNTFSSSSVVPLQEKIHSIPKPTTWKIDKLHRILKVRRGKRNSNMRETNLLSLSYGRIKRRDINTTDGLLPDSFEGYQIVEPGNIVLRLTDLQNDKKSLRQGLVTERGIITSAYDALETKKGHEPSFWYFVLFSLDLAKYYYSLGGGVRQSIKFADFPNEWIAFPSLEEQQSISKNLKKQENTYISLQEKFTQSIDLLKKYRTSLITAAVTGQIDVGTYKKTGRAENKFDDLQEKIEQ